MASLTKLPAELLLEILSYLPCSSLASVSQTSKALQPFAEPRVYAAIGWTLYSEDDGDDIRDPISEHPIHYLFRTLRQRPALAGHIETLQFLSGATAWYWSDGAPNIPPPASIVPLWLDALKLQSLPESEMAVFSAEIRSGNPGVFLGLLLSSLHGLVTLVTDYTMLCESDLPHIVFEQALGAWSHPTGSSSYQSSRFLKLKQAIIRNNVDSRIIKGIPKPRLSSIFCLSSLEHATAILQYSKSIPPWEAAGTTSEENLPNLRTLRLTDHLSKPRLIELLLANAKRLERLEYFLVEDTDDLAADDEYQFAHTDEWPAFSRALLSAADSLKTLIISIDEAATSDYPPDSMDESWMEGISARRGCIGSLRGLKNLTKLEIPTYILLGRYPHAVKLRDVLPPSLRKLYLRDDHIYSVDLDNCDPERVISLLRNYLVRQQEEDAAEDLLLEELRIKLRRGHRTAFDLGALASMSQEAGIKCTVHLRIDTFVSSESQCIDRVEQLTIYDPNTVDSEDSREAVVVGETAYPIQYVNEAARCFESNI